MPETNSLPANQPEKILPPKSTEQSSNVVWYLLIGINILSAFMSFGNLTWLDHRYSREIRGIMGLFLLISSILLFSQVRQPEPTEATEGDEEE